MGEMLFFPQGAGGNWHFTALYNRIEANSPIFMLHAGEDGYLSEYESLVFSDDIENVPEEYRQVGSSILMENDSGQTRSFLVTHLDDERLTVDGNNPLCGREVVFMLEILTVRDATDEEIRAGGAIIAGADIDPSRMRPV
jgi:FKBP-type peptidyl-prolyl cis-trans isomerase SlyD